MIDNPQNPGSSDQGYPFLDVILRDVVPEVKLALGDLIDRENARALPGRYAKLLPETLLIVTLRPDAAEALTPVAREIERELTDSCNRHGSLYDRNYRVQLRRAEDQDAPLFSAAAHAGQGLAEEPADEQGPEGAPQQEVPAPAAAVPPPPASIPAADPDATRLDGVAAPGEEARQGWEPGRWLLVVEDEQGAEQEVFRLMEPYTTIGRRSDDPLLRVTVALSGVPHVSRRHLALLWEPQGGEPGFRVYNLGLNPVSVADQEVTGANMGRGSFRLEQIRGEHTGWLPPGDALRIGDQGPTLRIQELPAPADDPDATVFE